MSRAMRLLLILLVGLAAWVVVKLVAEFVLNSYGVESRFPSDFIEALAMALVMGLLAARHLPRRPRILATTLTPEGVRRLGASTPVVKGERSPARHKRRKDRAPR